MNRIKRLFETATSIGAFLLPQKGGERLRFFYGDPEYGLLEGLMVTVPGFEKKRNEKPIRRNDICISSYHTKEGVENMVRRIISYKNSDEAMEAAKYLNKNKIFVSNDHKNLIAQICEGHRGKMMNSRSYLAAVFLLSADSELWNRVEKNVTDSGIAFSKIQAVGFNEEQNTIIQIAEHLYNGEHFVWYEELVDSEIVSKEKFVNIVNALLIRKYGADIFKMEREVE